MVKIFLQYQIELNSTIKQLPDSPGIICFSLLCSDQHQDLLCTGNTCINQVPLQHHKVVHQDRDHNNGKVREPGKMNCPAPFSALLFSAAACCYPSEFFALKQFINRLSRLSFSFSGRYPPRDPAGTVSPVSGSALPDQIR